MCKYHFLIVLFRLASLKKNYFNLTNNALSSPLIDSILYFAIFDSFVPAGSCEIYCNAGELTFFAFEVHRFAEPWWPSGNTLAFNAENPGSTSCLAVAKINFFSSRSTADRISGSRFKLEVTLRIAISNAILI